MKRAWIAFLLPVLSAQIVPGRYIVELAEEPAIASRAALPSHRATVRAGQARLRPQLQRMGARVIAGVETVANALIVEMAGERAERLTSIAGVARVHPVRLARPSLDRALPLHHVPDAWATVGGSGNAGAGIKIAILDSGISQDHPGFQDASLAIPPGFPLVNQTRDAAYTNNKVIVARNYVPQATPQDSFGHGTAVAMEAAGVMNTGPLGIISGVAPKAWLGSYKVYQNENPFPEDTALRALDDAVNDGMDVINLSFGIPIAQRIADDILVAAVERAAAMGVIIIAAAGNAGTTPSTIASPATAPSVIAVGASSNDRAFAPGAVRLSGTAFFAMPGSSGRSLISPITARLADVSAFDPTGEACGALPAGSLTGAIALIVRSPHVGRPCSFVDKLNNAQGAGAVGAIVYMNPDSPDLVTMDVRAAALPAVSVDYSSGAAIRKYLAKDPAATGTIQFTTSVIDREANAIAPFSSRGPNVDSTIKPDLLATGLFLYTATQNTNPSSFLYSPTGYVKEADGTSFAAPLVAGAAALLKAARPGLSAAQYRSLVVNSTGGSRLPVQLAGAGVLNVKAALQNTVAVSPVSLSFGAGSGAVDLTRTIAISNLAPIDDTITISTAPDGGGPALVAGSSAVRIPAGTTQQVTLRLSGSSLGTGEYQGYLHIQGTQSTVDTVVPYWYAVPDGVPRYVTELQGPEAASPGTIQDIYFRVTDLTGLPLPASTPVVRAASPAASVVKVTSEDDQSPGLFHAVVQLGRDDGLNVFEIQAGSVKRQVTILGLSE